VSNEQAVVLAAIAATVYALLTFLLLLEARGARIASTQAATVVARLTFSRDNQIDSMVRLQNFGPAVAEDVRLRIAFIMPTEDVIAERSLWVPAMAPGDDEPYLPALLLPDAERGSDAALAAARDHGALLVLEWSWTDLRRSWRSLLFKRATHGRSQRVNIARYHESILRGPRFLEPNVISVTQAAEAATERSRREAQQRRSLDSMEIPPAIQATIDAERFVERKKLWWARAYALPRYLARVIKESRRSR
jgi:hypothetical protein